MTRKPKETRQQKHERQQLLRVLSYALASRLRNVIRAHTGPSQIDEEGANLGREVTVTFRDLHWKWKSGARSIAARNRKKT